jgi:hypothetical protein
LEEKKTKKTKKQKKKKDKKQKKNEPRDFEKKMPRKTLQIQCHTND